MWRTAIFGLAAACASPAMERPDAARAEDASAPVDLAGNAKWALLSPDRDPWAAHVERPCDPLGLRDEGSFFEIDTRICPAVSVGQPALGAIRAGDRLTAVMWNQGLVADAPATGHVALAIDGHVVLEQEVPIPSEARVFELDTSATFAAPAGALVVFHVHNHGINNWRIAYVRSAAP